MAERTTQSCSAERLSGNFGPFCGGGTCPSPERTRRPPLTGSPARTGTLRGIEPELAVLTPQSIEFLALCCRQAAVAPSGVALRLCQSVPDRLCRRFELTRQLLRRPAGAHPLNHLAAELRRVGCSCLAHRGLLEPK